MNANLFAKALNKVKSSRNDNIAKSDPIQSEKQEEIKNSGSDILSRIKKPSKSGLVLKDQIGGQESRQEKRSPYPKNNQSEGIKTALGDRFIPKADLINQQWKHDLAPIVEKPKNRVFIRGLPMEISSDILRKVFEKYGEITGIHVDKDTADIYFANKLSAQKASESEIKLGEKNIKVMLCENNEKQAKNNTIKPTIVELAKMESEKIHQKDPTSILSRIKKPTNN